MFLPVQSQLSRTALITGIGGQDGALLAQLLLRHGYEVVGATAPQRPAVPRLEELGIAGAVRRVPVDFSDQAGVDALLRTVRPVEVYNFAGRSFVAASFEDPGDVASVNACGPARLLRAIRAVDPGIRFYQASTSEMFGDATACPQSEATPFQPRNPYAASKLFGHWVTVNHRERFGLHASSGICFNHESPLRGEEFLTRKVTLGLARIRHGRQTLLEVGNPEAQRDWGYAGDYVEAMWRMLQQPTAGDYVLATGRGHSVREFIALVAEAMGFRLAWEGAGLAAVAIDRATSRPVIRVNPAFFRPAEPTPLRGDPTRAWHGLGWRARMGLPELAALMAEADCRRVRDGAVA